MKTLKTTKIEESKVIDFNNDIACVYEQKGETRDAGASRLMMQDDCFRKGWGISQETLDKLYKELDRKNYDKFIEMLESALKKIAVAKKAKKAGIVAPVAPVAPAKKAGKAPKADKVPAKKAEPKALGRYGHRVGSSADFMDEMIFKGVKPADAAEAIVAAFPMAVEKAKAKFLVHVRYLKKEKGVEFATFKGDTDKVKAKTERI